MIASTDRGKRRCGRSLQPRFICRGKPSAAATAAATRHTARATVAEAVAAAVAATRLSRKSNGRGSSKRTLVHTDLFEA